MDNRDIKKDIVRLYAQYKYVAEGDKVWYSRNMKAAKALEPYPLERIEKVMYYLEKQTDFKWTLETVHKYITEDLEKLTLKKQGVYKCKRGKIHNNGDDCYCLPTLKELYPDVE